MDWCLFENRRLITKRQSYTFFLQIFMINYYCPERKLNGCDGDFDVYLFGDK